MQHENKTSQDKKNKRARGAEPTPPLPTGSILSSSALAKLGGSTLATPLEADASQQLADLAPTFGDILSSIGNGVATSQEALDRGLVQTATTLSNTNITIVTDVIQELDDDGLPVPEATQLVEETVSLINFVRPTAHEWSHVALSMDMSVGKFDQDQGMKFRKEMSSSRATQVGLFFGFLGIGVSSFKNESTFRSSESEFESNWSEGRVRMDAMLRPRNVQGFDPPATVTIGPQLFLSQGAVRETVSQGVVTARAVDLLVTARKADGSVNPNVPIVVDPGPFDISFASTEGFTGDQTNAQGQCRITLSRLIPNALFQGRVRGTVRVSLGQVEKRQNLSL